jgi:hypothetical protein
MPVALKPWCCTHLKTPRKGYLLMHARARARGNANAAPNKRTNDARDSKKPARRSVFSNSNKNIAGTQRFDIDRGLARSLPE